MRGGISMFEGIDCWTELFIFNLVEVQMRVVIRGFEEHLPGEVAGLQLLRGRWAAWWASWACCTDSLEMVGEDSTPARPAGLSAQGWPGASPTQWWCCYRGNFYQWGGYKRDLTKEKTPMRAEMCESGSLQRFIHHAASPKTRLVQQHFSKVSHLSVGGMLITAEDIEMNPTQFPVLSHSWSELLFIEPTWRTCIVYHTSRGWGSDSDTLQMVEQSGWTSEPEKRS